MGKGKKRSKGYYIQSAKRPNAKWRVIGPRMKGFLCTCNNRERECVAEAYGILNDVADRLYGTENPVLVVNATKDELNTRKLEDCNDDSDEDIEAQLKAEVAQLQKDNKAYDPSDDRPLRRFQQVKCPAKSCIFIQTTLDDPLDLSMTIMDDILSSGQRRTRHLLRMLPVQTTCKAFAEDIETTLAAMCKEYFATKGQSFCVVFKVRNNTAIKSESMVHSLAGIIKDTHPDNYPDLQSPDVAINVDIIQTICCLSILPGYHGKYKKYNLVELVPIKLDPLFDKESSKDGCSKIKVPTALKIDEKPGPVSQLVGKEEVIEHGDLVSEPLVSNYNDLVSN